MWNPLRETDVFRKDKPWLLNFFDRLRFYPCSAEEILQYREDFLRGKFHVEIEEASFHLGRYKQYLEQIHESAAAFKAHQEAAFQAERQRWKAEGLDHFISEEQDTAGHIEEQIPDGCDPVAAVIPGSVWKVLADEGEAVEKGQKIAVLESMKMEFLWNRPQTALSEGFTSIPDSRLTPDRRSSPLLRERISYKDRRHPGLTHRNRLWKTAIL